MREVTIYLGRIHACPDVYKRRKLGYHIVHDGERTDRDFIYGIDKDSLVKKLRELKGSNENIRFINGLPKKVREGWAPDYIFRRLQDEIFSEITRVESEDKLSA